MRFPHWPYLIIAISLAALALATTASAIEVPGDLVVSGHQPFASDNVIVTGNVTVSSGGWLELTNIDLIMNCSEDGEFTINVNNGGKLTMVGGSISAYQSMYRYNVILNGETNLEGVAVTDTWGQGQSFDASTGNPPSLVNMKGGIQIYSDDVYIGNSTLSDGLLCMVYVSGATPKLYGNTISDVIYDVRPYYQTTSNPSTTRWTAMAFGVIMDNGAARLESNVFTDIGVFTTMSGVYYRDSATNTNDYQTIAAAVGARMTRLDMESNSIIKTGVLTNDTITFDDGGNRVNQRFYRYHVAGVYSYQGVGASMKNNDISSSNVGLYVIVSGSTTGGQMNFDIIIDNVIGSNAKGGAMFVLNTVSRDCMINVSDSDFDDNGEGSVSATDDCGLVVTATGGSGDLTIIMEKNNFRRNNARGAYIDVQLWSGDTLVMVDGSVNYADNGGAGLHFNTNLLSGDLTFMMHNTTATGNNPLATMDEGAISLVGNALTARLDISVIDCTISDNTGNGLGINMGGTMAVNTATSTNYIFLNSQFNLNTGYGIYIFDSYGANAQKSIYNWKNIHASNNNQAVYVHSNSQLGNINFQLNGLTAADSSPTTVAVTIQLAAATYNPGTVLRDVRITYTTGTAAAATGLSLQGAEDDKRWDLELRNSLVAQPGTALDAQFCEVNAWNSNLTGVGTNSIVARDSNIHLRYCQVPDLSAQTQGTGIKIGVYFYQWFNLTMVAWQNLEPIANQTIVIKRYRAPQDEIYTARTDANGELEHAMIPFWQKDENNNPLRNDELQAFAAIRGDTLNSLWFDFNVSVVGIEDPNVPEVIINTPADGTVQKSGSLIIQGEIRDVHSGVRYVEVTLDNVVWYPAPEVVKRTGQSRASFRVEIYDLTDGVYTISIRGWDVARYPHENLSYQLITIIDVKIDTEPPYLQILEPEDPFYTTNKKIYEIIGHTERSVNIRRLTINDQNLQIFGNTFNYTTNLIEGTNTFLIIAEDTAGNINTVVRQIVLDTQEPTLIVSTPENGFSSRERDFEVSGDTERNSIVFVKLDDGQPQKVEDRGDTRFYFVQNIKENQEGVHKLTIISIDEAGNENEDIRYIKYDVTPPVLEDIIPPFDPKPTNDQRVYVAGRTDTEVIQVTVNGLIFPVAKGTFAVEINMLEGDQVLTIYVEDLAGNSNVTTRNIFVDVTPPLMADLTVSSTKAGGPVWDMEDGQVINERSVRFRGRMVEGDIRDMWIQVGTDNRSVIMDDPEAYTFYRDFNLDEGENMISFYASDIAGNKMRIIYILDVDPRAPEMDYFNPNMNTAMETNIGSDSVTISGKVTDRSAVTLMINNRQVHVVPNTGAFQTSVPLVEGLNNIEVVVTDRAGNTDSDLLHITYEVKGSDESSTTEALIGLWWVFAIVIGLLILVPITVHTTRSKWLEKHPELENYDPQLEKQGLYDYDEGPGMPPGGGY
jgi:hypothetical protein